MAKRSKRKKRKQKSAVRDSKRPDARDTDDVETQLSSEPRASVASTVAWLLCCFASAGSLILSGLAFAAHDYLKIDNAATMLAVFFAIALMTGILTLLLTLVVLRVREIPPPTAITATAIGIGATPMLILCVAWLAN